MKLNRKVLLALIASGSLGLAASPTFAADTHPARGEKSTDVQPNTGSADSNLAPSVPGVTAPNSSTMSAKQIGMAQKALEEKGYNPGRSDGTLDTNTRNAIRKFQKDNDIPVTGTIDAETARHLGMDNQQSSGSKKH